MPFEANRLAPASSPHERLGWMIRKLREAEGKAQQALADSLGISLQTVSRWENTGRIPLEKCRELDARWDTGGWLERLWYEAEEDTTPHQFGEFTRYERTATGLRLFGLGWVPGLLQTAGYARGVLMV